MVITVVQTLNIVSCHGSFAKVLVRTNKSYKSDSNLRISKIAAATLKALGYIFLLASGIIIFNKSIFLGIGFVSAAYLAKKIHNLFKKRIFFQLTHSSYSKTKPSQFNAKVCKDGKESFEWKKELIKRAEKEVILSGNYCGGKSFDEILILLEEKLKTIDNFKVYILSSEKWISESNHTKIRYLSTTYSERFKLLYTDDFVTLDVKSTRFKKSNNHTKALLVDGGKAFILGGSGIEDKYAYSDGLLVKNKKSFPVSTLATQDLETPKEASQSPINKQDSSSTLEKKLLKIFLARGFRDMDFVFSRIQPQEDNDQGTLLRQELLQLADLYVDINHQNDPTHSFDLASDFMGEYKKEKDFRPFAFSTESKFHPTSIRVFSQDPAHKTSPMNEQLLKLINKAKNSITINHMYFNPTPEVLKALATAINKRDVKIIITSNYDDRSVSTPKAHSVFVNANRYRINSLAQKILPQKRHLLEAYEFGGKSKNAGAPHKSTLHKKVVVVDKEWVLAGSSNLGYKSLVSCSDFEVNFLAKNKFFAQETEAVLEFDRAVNPSESPLQKHATKYDPLNKMSFYNKLSAYYYFQMAPLVN